MAINTYRNTEPSFVSYCCTRMKPIKPQPGQESVWDYPRPPRLEDVSQHIWIVFNDVIIADTNRAKRVLETSHPPVYYLPPDDIQMEYLRQNSHRSFCEFKGMAGYYDLDVNGKQVQNVAWFYPDPVPQYAGLRDYLAFYPSKADACYVGDERVRAQEGDFYGGWVTDSIVGPFKGSAGTWGW